MVVLSNFLTPREGIRHEERNTTAYINEREIGKGTLYITESALCWVNYETQQGFSLEYPHISLHAIAKDEQTHIRQCLYIMIDAKIDFPDVTLYTNGDRAPENCDEESDTPMSEMRFAPDNTINLEAMFQAMNQCQALHPDPQENSSEEQTETDQNGAENDEAMDIEMGQFEDAEEDL